MDRFQWDLGRELPGDRDLALDGDGLTGCQIALLVCGGIAAYRSPDLIRALRRQGAQVQVYVTPEALKFVTREVLEWCSLSPVIETLDGRAQHIEDARNVDLYLLAPATYSTLNKFALGVADNAVTSTLASALGRLERGACAVQVVPTMHGTMVNEVLRASLARLAGLGVEVVPPRPGAGKANIPAVEELVARAQRALAGRGGRPSLTGRRVFVTGGPTPVAVDDVRILTNRYSGRTAVAIAEAFWRAGADVELLLSGTQIERPSTLPTRRVADYDAYRTACLETSADLAIFSAAVADYRPLQQQPGKLGSGQPELTLTLKPTQKVVELWRQAHPEGELISFKLESGLSDEALVAVARDRVGDHSDLVVANHAQGGELFLVSAGGVARCARSDLGAALVRWYAERL